MKPLAYIALGIVLGLLLRRRKPRRVEDWHVPQKLGELPGWWRDEG